MFFPYQELVQLLLRFKYFILFPIVMFEGPITTMVAGFLSSLGYMHFWVAYLVAVVGDLTSDVGYYALGRWGRKRFIEKFGHYVGITPSRIERLEQHFHRHGGKMLIFGKIADPLSSTVQTIAGATRMPIGTYAYYNIICTFPKSLILIAIGFYFGEAVHQANFYRQVVGVVASILGILFLAAYFTYRRSKQRALLRDHEPSKP